jgi:hypothetical protein
MHWQIGGLEDLDWQITLRLEDAERSPGALGSLERGGDYHVRHGELLRRR